LTGQLFVSGEVHYSSVLDFSSKEVQSNIYQYFVGAILLSVFAFIAGFIVTFGLLTIFRKNPVKE
ncbi:MAG: hypothetical protein RLZ33_1029, partial [Bacteroidota bacterium]